MNKISIKPWLRFLIIPSIISVSLAASCNILPSGTQSVSGGILRSKDAAETWEVANKIANQTTVLSGVSASRVAVDASNPNIVYFSSPTSGIYKSSNKGDTWERILSGTRVYDFRIDPQDSQVLYAGGTNGKAAKLLKSSDQGKTWIELYSQSRPDNFVSAIHAFQKDSKIMFAALSTGELLKSVNGGTSWDLLKNFNERILKLETPVADSSRIYVFGMISGINYTADGGQTWQNLTKSLKKFKQYNDMFIGFDSLYVSGGSGLYGSKNQGGTWTKIDLPLNEKSSIVSLISGDTKNSKILYTSVGQTFYKSTDAGTSWQTITLPTGAVVRALAVDPAESNTLYVAVGSPLK